MSLLCHRGRHDSVRTDNSCYLNTEFGVQCLILFLKLFSCCAIESDVLFNGDQIMQNAFGSHEMPSKLPAFAAFKI